MPAMQIFAIVNLAVTLIVIGYAAAAQSDHSIDEPAVGGLVLVMVLNVVLCGLVLAHA